MNPHPDDAHPEDMQPEDMQPEDMQPEDMQPADTAADAELRRLLADLDPMSAGVPVEPVTSPHARHRLEQIMQTVDPSSTPTVVPLSRRRGPRLILAAAASVAVLALGTTVAMNLGGDTASQPTTMALEAPGGDPTMIGMCMRLDAEALRPVPVALAGTVTSLSDKTVTLHVDRWYKGGDADEVTIALPPGDVSPALVPGVDFAQGKRFLVTATEGTVNGCGFSGPAEPELQKVFDEAFGG
jgi:hypothetical protein